MNDLVNILPPHVDECERSATQGYLEIEVSHLNFITAPHVDNTPIHYNQNCDKFDQNRSRHNGNDQLLQRQEPKCVQVKFIWCGERCEDAANAHISYTLPPNRSRSQHKSRNKQLKQRQFLLSRNSVRYHVYTSRALFLAYLRSCAPIRIVVSSSSVPSNNSEPLGQASLCVPSVFLRKYVAHHTRGHNFEHKSKIYALYRPDSLSPTSAACLTSSSSQKTGEIQLLFRMLFAPDAVHGPVVVLQEKPDLIQQRQHHATNGNNSLANFSEEEEEESQQAEKAAQKVSQSKSAEIAEIMKKLDTKLLAYLNIGNELTSKGGAGAEQDAQPDQQLSLEHTPTKSVTSDTLVQQDREAKLKLFKNMSGIRLEMEALTLQPEGTKRMELLQSEIRPIFTIECQLSNELIIKVPRYKGFHIMQFESEKFQSLTQCTRFGQEAERTVRLNLDEYKEKGKIDFGRIRFTVWWREPGTCLNEMLGMGVLEIEDLYNASLIEQCKCIAIKRRGTHLANVYLKITLQCEAASVQNGEIKQVDNAPLNDIDEAGDDKQSSERPKQHSGAADDLVIAQAQNQGKQSTSSLSASEGDGNAAAGRNNNNLQLESSSFLEETSKIRVLKGFVYANETRQLPCESSILVCRRFWCDEPVTAAGDERNRFNYQEQFAVINDEKFLKRVDKQYLHLELWQRMNTDDGNGNDEQSVLPLGIVRMPLHQFFIAYRDVSITNHLCKGKLPVISIDAWAPVLNCESGTKVGELKCLLALGSEEQIRNLREERGFSPTLRSVSIVKDDILKQLRPLNASDNHNKQESSCPSPPSSSSFSSQLKKSSNILDILQKSLPTLPHATVTTTATATTTTVTTSISKPPPLQQSNVKLFRFALEIQRATGLPLNLGSKLKKGSKRNTTATATATAAAAASKRFPPNEPPSTYVTFQAEEGQYNTYKSHEGMVFATTIVEKSTEPQWQQRFRLGASMDYLSNPNKRFILKVWKKSRQSRDLLQPSPMNDAIIGFAALDLGVFLRGLHIGGSFNIVDFNGRINGQLEVRCHPLQDLNPTSSCCGATSSMDSVIDQLEQKLDLTHLNLGQAIKRKFAELEGISQRLRTRLTDVTGTELAPDFDFAALERWQPSDSDRPRDDDDAALDEFEHDLNTPVEEVQVSENSTEHKKSENAQNREK